MIKILRNSSAQKQFFHLESSYFTTIFILIKIGLSFKFCWQICSILNIILFLKTGRVSKIKKVAISSWGLGEAYPKQSEMIYAQKRNGHL